MKGIAIDGGGAENGLVEVIKGILNAAKKIDCPIYLFADDSEIDFDDYPSRHFRSGKVKVIDCKEVVEMSDSSDIIVAKKDSTIARAIDYVKDGVCFGVYTPGSTIAASILGVRKLRKINTQGPMLIGVPPLATIFPSRDFDKGKYFVALDLGTNVLDEKKFSIDERAESLLQNAILGSLYYHFMLNKNGNLREEKPLVGLACNGTEDIKGTPVLRRANELMKQYTDINYAGFVEDDQPFEGKVDVFVMDGYDGNRFLKTTEGALKAGFYAAKKRVLRNPLSWFGVPFVYSPLKGLKRDLSSSKFGACVALGMGNVKKTGNPLVMVGHGKVDAEGVKSAVLNMAEHYKQKQEYGICDLVNLKARKMFEEYHSQLFK